MLQSIKSYYGKRLGASDGEIGHVSDFYFDDHKWTVRYMVVDTGNWMPGRQVLISPHAFDGYPLDRKFLQVHLTKRQIEDSPSIDAHKPVSRQYEDEYHRYYGWPSYWTGNGLWGNSNFPLLELSTQPLRSEASFVNSSESKRPDANLRSTQSVGRYQVQSGNDNIGYVSDFLLNPRSWAISQLAIKYGNLFSNKEVELLVSNVERISYERSTVLVNMTASEIQHHHDSQVLTESVT